MAAASLIHFGVDTCFRLPVLRSAGFEIAECDSLDELPEALASYPDAVVLEEEPDAVTEKAISLTRSRSKASLILFASGTYCSAPAVDLVIPSFTTPELWLHEIREIIERSHQVRAEAKKIKQMSVALVRDSAAARDASRETRERSMREREKMARRLVEMRKRPLD